MFVCVCAHTTDNRKAEGEIFKRKPKVKAKGKDGERRR
jgi:hypothetical protein